MRGSQQGKVMVGGSMMSAFTAGERAFGAGNYQIAYQYYKFAAENDDTRAFKMLGQYYHFGYRKDDGEFVVEPDKETARNYYQRAVDAGDRTASNNLRMMEVQEAEAQEQQGDAPAP